MKDHILRLSDLRPDGVIVSDPGAFSLVQQAAPHLPLHVSTQANVTNREAARFWERLGAKRLILSRELSLDEIRDIRQSVSVELEVFVHGSICISYSGRCYISSFLAGRSANAGSCTNSCRWNYALTEEKRPGEHFPVYEDDRGTYLLSSKDLCMIGHLGDLAEAGIDSFKIEGRMKGVNYVAGVVKAYREAIDLIGAGNAEALERLQGELEMLSSRGYTTGMFFGQQKDDDYNFDGESYRMTHDLVGVVTAVADGLGTVALRSGVRPGDAVEYLTPGLEGKSFSVLSLMNCDGESCAAGRNDEVVRWPVPSGVRPYDLVRRLRRQRQ